MFLTLRKGHFSELCRCAQHKHVTVKKRNENKKTACPCYSQKDETVEAMSECHLASLELEESKHIWKKIRCL